MSVLLTSAEVSLKGVSITPYALARWKQRAVQLRLDSSEKALQATLARAIPEVPANDTTSFHLLKRSVMLGGNFFAADGWRFVVKGKTVVTIERQRSHENFHGAGFVKTDGGRWVRAA